MAEANRSYMRLQWRAHKLAWGLSGGRLGRRLGGMPVLELISVGRKSGQPRQILIWYVDDDGMPVLIGTNAGRDADPAWARNLRAEPNARARWDGQWHEIRAVEVSGSEHGRLWTLATEIHPGYGKYQESLTRPIPIVRLEPRERGEPRAMK